MARSDNQPIARQEADGIVSTGLYGFALYGLAMCNCNEGVVRLLDQSRSRTDGDRGKGDQAVQ